MIKILKLVASRLAVLAVLVFIAAAIILYQAGKYDISFIPREPKTTDTSEDATRPGGASTSADSHLIVTEDIGPSITNGDTTTALDSVTVYDTTTAEGRAALDDEYRAFIGKTKSYNNLVAQGYADTGAMFDKSAHVLAILPPTFEYPKVFSHRRETEQYTQRVATSLGYETQFKTREVDRPALKLYMGLRIIDNGDKTYGIYGKHGNRIAGSAYPFAEVYARDADGYPIMLFGTQYYSVRPDGSFIPINFDPTTLPGVVFDAPEYYAKSSIKLYPYSQERVVYVMVETDERKNKTETVLANLTVEEYEQEQAAKEAMAKAAETKPPVTQPAAPIIDPLTGKPVAVQPTTPPVTEAEIMPETTAEIPSGENEPVYEYRRETLWGFKDDKDNVVITAQYKAVYTFSENGLAAVVGYNGELRFIDTTGRTVINPYGNILYLAEFDNRRSYDGFYPADTKLPENLGMYYFDHGLVRVRRQIKDYYFKKRVAIDRDYLIDRNGVYFAIPENYNLIAYSDGVLTLEKDGYYGYYSHRGYWIAQPVYTVCKPFVQGLGVIGYKDGKCAMIDTSGNIVIPFVFDYISQPSDGVIAAYSKTHGWTEFITMARP